MKQAYAEQESELPEAEKAAVQEQIKMLTVIFQNIFEKEADPQLKSLYQRLQVP